MLQSPVFFFHFLRVHSLPYSFTSINQLLPMTSFSLKSPSFHCHHLATLLTYNNKLRLTVYLLFCTQAVQLSSASDSKSVPSSRSACGSLPDCQLHPSTQPLIHCNIYWAPTMCQMTCQDQRDRIQSHSAYILVDKTTSGWETIKTNPLHKEQAEDRKFWSLDVSDFASCPLLLPTFFYWGKIYITLN